MIQFLIPALLMALMITAFVVRALWQKGDAGEAPAVEVALYKAQLRQLDKDVARGLIAEDEAQAMRVEISRRILAADAAQNTPLVATKPSPLMAGGLALAILAGSFALYWQVGAPGMGDFGLATRLAALDEARAERPGQLDMQERQPAQSVPEPPEDIAALITQLRQVAAERPNDITGQRLLVETEARLGRFADAWPVQERLLNALGPEAQAVDYTDAGELMVLAIGGYVSPEAEAHFRSALARNPEDPRARFYIGLMLIQGGRPDLAFDIWERLLRESDPNDPWVPAIRADLPGVAAAAGIRYELPPLANTPGPTAEDIAAAEDLTPEQRQQMIEGMVTSLETRLAQQGGTADEFARLIRALVVLGRIEHADAIYREALTNFSDRPDDFEIILSAGRDTGLEQ